MPGTIKNLLVKYLSENKDNSILNFMRKLKRLMANYDSDFNNMQINYLDQLSNKEFLSFWTRERIAL